MVYSSGEIFNNIKRDKDKYFEEIVEQYSTKVLRVCYVQIGDIQESEDLSQEVFMKIYKNIERFNGESSLYTWIYRITINTCFSYLKKNKKIITIELKEDHKSEEDVYESVLLNLSKKLLKEALYRTPQEFRIVLYMHYFEGMKVNEISEILELNSNTVKTRLRRGREYIKSYCGGEVNG